MIKRTDIKPALAFCGGVARNTAIAKGLEEYLGLESSSRLNPISPAR